MQAVTCYKMKKDIRRKTILSNPAPILSRSTSYFIILFWTFKNLIKRESLAILTSLYTFPILDTLASLLTLLLSIKTSKGMTAIRSGINHDVKNLTAII